MPKQPKPLQKRALSQSKKKKPTPKATGGVYVLELKGGYVYVGKASDIRKRVANHIRGNPRSEMP